MQDGYIIEVIPLMGIKWKDKSINLLDSKEEIKNILGEPYTKENNSYYYFNNELRFDFNEQGKVEFIEFLAGINGSIQPQIYDVRAFEVNADTLYDILKDKNNGNIDNNENGYSYGFLNLSVGIFRETTPESVKEMVDEAQADGEPMDIEDIKYETEKANHWDTIGIGIKDYYY